MLAILVLTSFQNCSSQDFSNSLTQASASKVDASNMDKIPFAFDFVPNQISYMSCSRSADKNSSGQSSSTTHLNDPNVFYTFKIGAYGSGGLALRREFIDFVKANFSNKGVLGDSEIQDALSYGTAHGGAALQLAIRGATPVTTKVYSVGEITEGITYKLFPQNVLLTAKEFLPQMVSLFRNPSTRLNVLGSSSLQSYRLEAALHPEQNSSYTELTSENMRQLLQTTNPEQSNLLAVTYSHDLRQPENSSSMWIARDTGSTSSDNRAWGSGYKLTFASDMRISSKQSVIGSITEYNLSTFEPTTSVWKCPQSFRYIIVSPQDRTAYPCVEVTDESTLNAVQRDDLNKIRRHLTSGEWIVDPIHQCVSPKRPNLDCYGNRAFNPVAYTDSGTQCGLDSNNLYLHKDCAEFVSFCFRQ